MVSELRFGAIFPIFRGPFLKRVAEGRHVSVLRELVEYFSPSSPSPPPNLHRPLKEWFDYFYRLLLSNYRCEYVYKNAIATKLYLDLHDSPQKSLINELRIEESRADVVILNGTSTVYEIKSAYDSFDRLDSQLEDYRKVFDRMVVVTTTERANFVVDRVPDIVGVMSLDEKGELAVVKEASSNKANTDPSAVFDCMRKSEFCAAVKAEYGDILNVSNSRLYRKAKALFCQIDPIRAHDLMVQHVRRRGKKGPFADLVDSAPKSLKHACLSFSESQALAIQIKERLAEPLST